MLVYNTKMQHSLTQLNRQQQAAVTAADKYLLILAGAGSGKTLTLVERIVYLIEQGLATPHSIVAVTFTNKAAHEMRQRIAATLKREIDNIWLGTFHAINHRILRKHHRDAGLIASFQILDDDDQKRLIRQIILNHDLNIKQYAPKDVQNYINQHKEQGIRATDAGADNPFFNLAKTLYLEYEKTCKSNSLVDFAELILAVVELLEQNQSVRSLYEAQFTHLLVDEFQDTNHLQYRWLQLIAGKRLDITVVGDDDQSIYGWRGAQIANIHDFTHRFEGCQLIRLEQNYRSSGNILQLANSVIANNPNRLGKALWTNAAAGEPAHIFTAYSDTEEIAFVLDSVAELLNAGYNPNDIAVLYRSNILSRAIEAQCIKIKMPYKIFGGYRFYDRLEIKNALAYLRLLHNRDDDTAFERIINMPPRGIGKRTVDQLRQFARSSDCSLWQSLIQILQDGSVNGRGRTALNGFFDCIEAMQAYWEAVCKDKENGSMLAQLVDFIIKESGLQQHYMNDKSDSQSTRLENLEELVSACHEYGQAQQEGLSEFLSSTILDAGDLQAENYQQAISLMTIHASKGLEFNVIFIIGFEEGLFPHEMNLCDTKLEEERRLCYVALTRAKQRLYISHSETRLLHGTVRYNSPSRFLREMAAANIEHIQTTKTANELFSRTLTRRNTVQNKAEHGYSLGAHVVHPTFGDGTIVATEGAGERLRLQIHFHDMQANKWILASFSKLIVH